MLQCSCLENPRDRGAWWAAVYGVTQIWATGGQAGVGYGWEATLLAKCPCNDLIFGEA